MTTEGWPDRSDLYLVGLTGNIATGKTLVDSMLTTKGAVILDADVIVHELERKGQPVLRRIVERFGSAVLQPNGELDRAKLGRIVFGNPAALRDLEAIVHPAVRAETTRRLREAPAGSVVVIDAIKLFENRIADHCDSVWVVVAPPDQQLRRLIEQRSLPEDVARERIEAQPPQSEKISRADVVIDNSGAIGETQARVEAAWQQTAGRWLAQREESGA